MGEDVVYLFLHAIAETVDCHEVGPLLGGKPDIMDVALNRPFHLAARIDVVHVCIKDDFEHHLRMVRTTAFLMVKFLELSQVKALDYRIDYAHRIVFSDILVGIHCQKQSFVIVKFCM